MEKRLGRLQTLWQADPTTIIEASWDLQWALQYPHFADPTERYQHIVAAHGLDEDDLRRALVRALMRCGAPRGEAMRIAELGVESVLVIAAHAEVA